MRRRADMAKFNQIETEVKGWATAHVILAIGIAFAVGVIVGAMIG